MFISLWKKQQNHGKERFSRYLNLFKSSFYKTVISMNHYLYEQLPL